MLGAVAGAAPGCTPKDHVTFVIFQTAKSTQILGFSQTGPLFTMQKCRARTTPIQKSSPPAITGTI
jgi:hypothetical protein